VELQIPLTLLREWQTDLPGLEGWASVITDVIRQLDAARAQAAKPPVSDADGHAEARRRFAGAGLRRWVQIRDRVCTAPGCRAPASRSELDHINPHSHGGLTTARNLEAACSHDHDLRDHGWRVIQPGPGQVIWISRTGHRYPVRTPPIIEPFPSAWPGTMKVDAGTVADEIDLDASAYLLSSWEDIPIWWEPAFTGPGREPFEQSKMPPPNPARDVPPF